jgi:predicted esterase
LLAAPPEIERRLPPLGIEIPEQDQQRLKAQLRELQQELRSLDSKYVPDAEVFLKAVDYALRHGEIYNEKEIPRAYKALELAKQRIAELSKGSAAWRRQRGLVVRGYRSSIDDSVQPYGLVIPEDLNFDKPAPLYVWLHGRGDKITDLHFIHRRLTSNGQIQPSGAIVLHPFGRQCIGYKSACEVDVFEAIADVHSQYNIDESRVVLMGFSMGGAGVWHIGAHNADRFVAMSPGAGFAETSRYNKLKRDDYPPWYGQKLWRLYDVPNYTRNLFNLPVVAYSGELDKQIQAARVMEEAFREHGRELSHVIGPGMGHKYHPESLKDILARIDAAVKKGLDRKPTRISLQTMTLRYNRVHWIEVLGLKKHWVDARIDAEFHRLYPALRVKTKNVTRFGIRGQWLPQLIRELKIDDDLIRLSRGYPERPLLPLLLEFEKKDGHWARASSAQETRAQHQPPLQKRPGLQGPIDDAFMDPFLVVLPSNRSSNEAIQEWLDFEQQHFIDRWRALFRGELRVKEDVDVTDDDLLKYHLVAWGTPETNRFLNILASPASGSPIRWTKDEVRVGERSFDAAHHIPVFVYPRGDKYLVVNSGPTFREGHDRTNSLQNPKLPDWAVIDLRQPPDDLTPGRIVAADFFDEQWQLKPRNIDPNNRIE